MRGVTIRGGRVTDPRPASRGQDIYRLVVENSRDMITVIDDESNILYASPSWETQMGYAPATLMGTSGLRLVHPDDLQEAVGKIAESMATGSGFMSHVRLLHADGRWLDFEGSGSLINDDRGRPLLLTTLRGIEERLRAEEDRARLAAIVESSDDAIIGKNLDDVIVSWNEAAERIYGYTAEDAIGRHISFLMPPEKLDELAEIRQRIARGERLEPLETRRRRKDGVDIDISLTVSPIRDGSGRLIGASTIGRDITERKRTEEELIYLAFHDRLTGLANRPRFEEELESALARARRHGDAVAVLYLDLDDFKLVNDALGHHVGDELLREVASRLPSAARETDVVARLGGDEFLVLLADLEREPDSGEPGPLEVAQTVAARIHEALKAPIALNGTDVVTTGSIGVSIFPTSARDAEGILANADSAMYRSKRSGPGRTLLSPERETDFLGRLSLVTSLRKAAEERQWTLRYQPIVDLSDGRVVGTEALLRWRGPDGRLILPGEFLPLALETGLMESIGDWVIQEVCRQVREWRALGLSLLTAVNLSPLELHRRDVLQVILDEVTTSGIEPSSLIIEVTETAAMMDAEITRDVLQGFRDQGLRVAIDDFGTGYSSLARLKHLPAHILKIDRSFLFGIPGDPDATSVVVAMIELARTLGMVPLAEGIETREQWRFLAERGCTLGQGWFFGRPAVAEKIPSLVREHTGARGTDAIASRERDVRDSGPHVLRVVGR